MYLVCPEVSSWWTLWNRYLGSKELRNLFSFFFSNATACPLRLRGLPPPTPRLWLKCNRLLKLGRPVGAVTLSRWEWWWSERWIWGAGEALNLISTNYPDHYHHGRLPLSRKNAHGRAGNRIWYLMVSSRELWPPSHEARQIYFHQSNNYRSNKNLQLVVSIVCSCVRRH